MFRKLVNTSAIVVGFSLMPSLPAAAQVDTGSILINVTDEQKAPMPGVSVTISGSALLSGRMTAVTDTSGVLRFPSLQSGIYTIQLELQGFQTLVREDVVVSVGQTTQLNPVLKVAAVEETVTVSGQSPVVDTTSANVSVLLTDKLLQGTPGGRDIWALMEYKTPGLITSRPDVGGAAGGLQASFSARGTPSSQNSYFLNGINVGSPSAIGATSIYFDYGAFEEMQVSTGMHDMSVSSPGVFLNMVTKTGADRWSGRGSLFWAGNQLQGTNINDGLSAFGFRKEAGAVEKISDGNVQFGGPVVKESLRVFGSVRDWRVHVNVPGFPEVEETNILTGLTNATWQANSANRLTGFASLMAYKKPNRGASALLTPESTFREDNPLQIYQGLWNSVFSNRAFMDARVSFMVTSFRLFQKGSDQSLLDLSNNTRLRNAAQEDLNKRHRLQTSVNFQYFVDQALGGRHEFRFGLDNQHAPTWVTQNRHDDLNLAFRSVPLPTASTVTLFNSPLQSRTGVDVLAFFAQDSYTVGRLTLFAGARWERLEAYLPEQGSVPSRWFPNATRQFDEVRDVINWKNLAPRASFVYDLFGTGKTAVKAAVGRYHYQISTNVPNAVNPNFTFSETYNWIDQNGDLRFQPGEQGALLSRAGGSVTTFDTALRRPYSDEMLAGVDHELIPSLKLSAIFTYRQERDNFGPQDVGVPFSAYSLVPRADLGRDGVADTSDDASIFVWNQDPATRGQNRFVNINSDALNQAYRGLEITANKRFDNGWQMLAGYTVSKAVVNAENVRNPNDLVNSTGVTALDRTHTFKLTGSYLLPHDISLSGNLRTQTGVAVTRTATFPLTQGNVTINVEPRGSERLDPLTTLDTRVSKTFRVRAREVELMVDAYNLTNANTAWEVRNLTGRINVREGGVPTGALINQQQYLSPTQILPPRIFRLGATFRF